MPRCSNVYSEATVHMQFCNCFREPTDSVGEEEVVRMILWIFILNCLLSSSVK